MRTIEFLKKDKEAAEILYDICDVAILPEFKIPEDEFGHLSYNITGKTFGKDGSGGEYILLEDGSVGFWGSEGETGRISDSITDFFEFMVNCPYWRDYVHPAPFKDIKKLRQFATENYAEHIQMMQEDMEIELIGVQTELAKKLGITLYKDVAGEVLMKFYHSALREPELITVYIEDDGSKHSSSGSLFKLS